jgi:hypothetical protein
MSFALLFRSYVPSPSISEREDRSGEADQEEDWLPPPQDRCDSAARKRNCKNGLDDVERRARWPHGSVSSASDD